MADINGNGYTLTYAIIMTLLVAVLLAATATGLKPMQDEQELLDKKMSILNSVESIDDKSKVDAEFSNRIVPVVVDGKGNVVEGADPFAIEPKKEYRNYTDDKPFQLPVYVYTGPDQKKKYIFPMHGAGLWDEIWGFVALDSDFNTITGTAFDHKGETPGLGAELSKPWFEDQFKGKTLADAQKHYELKILKGRGHNIAGKPFEVDGMSGATITGNGVQNMLEKGYDALIKPYAAAQK